MEELETKYYIITFADGHKAYMHTDSHLWEALKLHYDDGKISLIQRVTESEFYNEIFNQTGIAPLHRGAVLPH
jgi:hypothetical protein